MKKFICKTYLFLSLKKNLVVYSLFLCTVNKQYTTNKQIYTNIKSTFLNFREKVFVYTN